MSQYLILFLLGLAPGALSAAFGLSLVITHRATGVVNFAQAAIAMWGVYVYDELRRTGDLVLPVVALPSRIQIGPDVPAIAALALGVASAAFVGGATYVLVLRHMRTAPALGRVVATIGVLLVLQAIVTLRFGTDPRSITPLLPRDVWRSGSVTVTSDRFIVTVLVLAAAAVLWLWFRVTRTGLATRAASESEKGAILVGLSPHRLALTAWAVASSLSACFAILISPAIGMSPALFPLFIVGGLAAALVGRFRALGATAGAGILLGCLQSGMIRLQSFDWLPVWAQTGLGETLPLVVIVVALFLFGHALPQRGDLAVVERLPSAPMPKRTVVPVVAASALAILALGVLTAEYRLALIVSVIGTLLAASVVFLTGYLGQISLAQTAFAGTAAFFLSKATAGWGVPFPVGPLIAIVAATLLGFIAGVPALRIRGPQLAVATLAVALTAERFVFLNRALLDQNTRAPVPSLRVLGAELGPFGGGYPRPVYGVVVIVVVALAILAALNLRRGVTGLRMLAVRESERAAAAAGIGVASIKLLGFAVSAALAATAGVLTAYLRGEVSASGFGAAAGIAVLAIAYLGGVTTMLGALVAGSLIHGGMIFLVLNERVDLGRYYALATGVALVGTAMLNPQGIVLGVRQHLRLRA